MLTDEQKERIKKNRERALAIRKKRVEDKKIATKANSTSSETPCNTQTKTSITEGSSDQESVELEEFEIDASPFVTKQEAMKKYCLPQGKAAG